jgi:hypothetical protein
MLPLVPTLCVGTHYAAALRPDDLHFRNDAERRGIVFPRGAWEQVLLLDPTLGHDGYVFACG